MPAFEVSCIDVLDFLECLEIRNIQRATEREFRFSCPYPAHSTGDADPSCYMNVETTAYMCHSCHAKGNAVQFASDILGLSPIETTRMLKQRYSPHGIDPDSRNRVEELRRAREKSKKTLKRTNRVFDESVLNAYAVDWPTKFSEWNEGAAADWVNYLFSERKFEPEDLMDWQFGYSSSLRRITLPVRDEGGRIVGIKARSYLKWHKPKYLNLRDDENDVEPYLKNDVVFGLDRARKFGTDLIVVEGEYNVVAMHGHGYTNTVAINGSYFGERQVRLLKQFATSITLFFDSDTAGNDAAEALSEALRLFLPIYVCPEHHGDPAEMHRNSIEACIEARESLTVRRMAMRS